MPKFLPLTNFALGGLNTDMQPWDLPVSFLTDIDNIRVRDNQLENFGGESLVIAYPGGFDPKFFMIGKNTGPTRIAADDSTIRAYDGTSWVDVTKSGQVSVDSNLWEGCNLSGLVVMCNIADSPQYWDGSGQFLELPWSATETWADVGAKTRVIRSHKDYLFALSPTVSGQEKRDNVRWSAPADTNGLPSTWDPLDTTNFAGIVTLGGDGGNIVDGLSLRDAFVVYRERGVSVFDYIGGQYVWRIRHLTGVGGLLSTNCVAEVNGKHYYIGEADIYVNDGNSITSIIHKRIKKRFAASVSTTEFTNSFVVKNIDDSEIWFCVPSAETEYAVTAFMYNYKDDSWAIRNLDNIRMADAGPEYSGVLTWDNIQGSWDEAAIRWEESLRSPIGDTVQGIGPLGLVNLDLKNFSEQSDFNSAIERTGLAIEGLDNVTTITRVYPHMSGIGPVYVQIGSQDYPGAPVRWKAKTAYYPGVDRKVDIRTTGELHCFRITSDSKSKWQLSGLDLEYVFAGKR